LADNEIGAATRQRPAPRHQEQESVMQSDPTQPELSLDEAIEKLGELVSQAGGRGYDALDVVKEAASALQQISACGRAIDARLLAHDALKGWTRT
jgi:hypothetical protein